MSNLRDQPIALDGMPAALHRGRATTLALPRLTHPTAALALGPTASRPSPTTQPLSSHKATAQPPRYIRASSLAPEEPPHTYPSLTPRLPLSPPRLLVRATLCGTLRPCATLRPRLQCSAVGGPHAWRAISALPPVATLSVLPHDTPAPPHAPQKATSQTINYQGRRPAFATT